MEKINAVPISQIKWQNVKMLRISYPKARDTFYFIMMQVVQYKCLLKNLKAMSNHSCCNFFNVSFIMSFDGKQA